MMLKMPRGAEFSAFPACSGSALPLKAAFSGKVEAKEPVCAYATGASSYCF
jgi:hypothetical protein